MTVTRTRLTTKAATVEKSLRMSVQAVRKPSKYRSTKTWHDGIKFDSAKEAARYRDLRTLEKAGKISGLVLQPQFKFEIDGRKVLTRSEGYPNGRQVSMKLDFAYYDETVHAIIYEDVKSQATMTTAYKLRKAFLEAMRPDIRVIEV